MRLLLITSALCLCTNLAQADASPPQHMQAMQGVYKQRFPNGTIDGKEKWMSEDVVEIVPMDSQHIYVRAELSFANGHVCSISGAASHTSKGFVYQAPAPDPVWKTQCTLRVTLTPKDLVLSDFDETTQQSTCQMHCGARGSLHHYAIERSTRRPIRYMPRLLASPQYQEALQQLPGAAPAQ